MYIIKIKYNQDSNITISKSEDRSREIIDIQIILRDSYVNFIIMYFRTLYYINLLKIALAILLK